MILFIDTETTGLVQFPLPHDHPSQPDLVQLGMVLCDDDGAERAAVELIVKPDGYTIPRSASDVHGITTETALRCGVSRQVAVAMFANLRKIADSVAAHNLPFDERVLATALHRAGKTTPLEGPIKRICTLELCEPVLKLPATERMRAAGRANQYKKPNLGECVRYFFGEDLPNTHTALADARACARIYFQVVLKGGARIDRSPVGRALHWIRSRR